MGSHYSTRMDCIDLFAEVIETVTYGWFYRHFVCFNHKKIFQLITMLYQETTSIWLFLLISVSEFLIFPATPPRQVWKSFQMTTTIWQTRRLSKLRLIRASFIFRPNNGA